MSHRLAPFCALALGLALTTTPSDAEACGGCFVAPTESTVVSGHRMALSISTEKTTLWDAIEYAGDPTEFSWVLPVKPGAEVDVAHQAFFTALEAGTVSQITPPPEGCEVDSSSGCGSDQFEVDSLGGSSGSGTGGGVTVIQEKTVGPYDSVTLAATDPTALNTWLDDNGYGVPEDVQPIIDAYVAEGFDFIALKLSPGQGVRSMTPVRVTTIGSSFELPLRMVAAGAAANVDLVLYVLAEGRYEAANFGNGHVPQKLVTWDFRTDSSNYAELRLAALGADEGNIWLTTHAERDGLIWNGPGAFRQINTSTGFFSTIAEVYFNEGLDDPQATHNPWECVQDIQSYADKSGKVGSAAAPLEDFTCGELDDIAVALEGIHLQDLWITRLEASLPKAALSQDLKLQAASEQERVPSAYTAELKVNHCWDSERASSGTPVPWWMPRGNGPLPPGAFMMLVMGAAGLYLVARRRREEAL